MTKTKAVAELTFAGVLWGFGFVAAVWSLGAFTPVETLVWRFIVASVLGELLFLIARGPARLTALHDFKKAFPAGLFLGGMLLLQTIGLKYTTATKSGFITCLYVIFVPLMNTAFFKTRSHWFNYILALTALLGTFILMGAKFENVNTGDLWTLGCSIFATFHIIYIGRISTQIGEAFRFNNFQSIWALIILTPLLLTQDQVQMWTTDVKAWAGILSLGLCSSVIAFYLQVRSQRVLTDSTASMLFLLESPVAALFGFLLLQERLSLFQASGALIILLASALQILSERAKTR
ncbi:EamA-like transporter family protein [compost metagenome]